MYVQVVAFWADPGHFQFELFLLRVIVHKIDASNCKCKIQQINKFTRTFAQPPRLPLSKTALIVSVFLVPFWLVVVLSRLQHHYIPIKKESIQARKTTKYVLTKNTPLGSTTYNLGPLSSTAPNIVLIPKGRTDE